MGKLKIKFHPLFAIYVFLCVYFGWFNQIFFYVVTVTLHEFGHYLAIKYYGYEMDALIFSLSGAGLKGNNNFKSKHEIIISLCGPIVNIILIIITIASWWIFPMSYLYTREFLLSNIVVFVFNILPLYPLDGGRIITSILVNKGINKNKIIKYNKILCILFGGILLFLFLVSLLYSINYNLAIISGFMFVNSISIGKNSYFDKVSCLNKNNAKPIEVKVFKLNEYDRMQMIKTLSPHYYSIFEVGEGDIKKVIKEDELLR